MKKPSIALTAFLSLLLVNPVAMAAKKVAKKKRRQPAVTVVEPAKPAPDPVVSAIPEPATAPTVPAPPASATGPEFLGHCLPEEKPISPLSHWVVQIGAGLARETFTPIGNSIHDWHFERALQTHLNVSYVWDFSDHPEAISVNLNSAFKNTFEKSDNIGINRILEVKAGLGATVRQNLVSWGRSGALRMAISADFIYQYTNFDIDATKFTAEGVRDINDFAHQIGGRFTVGPEVKFTPNWWIGLKGSLSYAVPVVSGRMSDYSSIETGLALSVSYRIPGKSKK